MYQNVAILAAVIVLYGVVSGRIARSWLSGPIVCTAAGVAAGPLGLGVLHLDIAATDLRTLAEAALAMVLFTDAAHADLAVVRRAIGLPERLLLIGLPLTIVLGFVVAIVLFPGLDLFAAALLATLLAPTDAALGAPVVTNKGVPGNIRESLNLESGLNDGICVPIVIILLDLAVGTEIERSRLGHVVMVIVEEIGIGLLAGAALAAIAAAILPVAARTGWTAGHWRSIVVVGLAALCFASAQALGGSGFIACFVAGLVFGHRRADDHSGDDLGGAACTGDVLAMLTWVAFGAAVVTRLLELMTWPMLAYALLSLTVIRMAPVFVSLLGSPLGIGAKLFIGWFGPRGLASIVFAVIVVDAGISGKETLVATAALTVLLSVIAHGATANPLIARLAAASPPQAGPREERGRPSRSGP